MEKPYSPGVQLALLLLLTALMYLFVPFIFGMVLTFMHYPVDGDLFDDYRVYLAYVFCVQLFLHFIALAWFLKITDQHFRDLVYVDRLNTRWLLLLPVVLIASYFAIEGTAVFSLWVFEATESFGVLESYHEQQLVVEGHLTHSEPFRLMLSLFVMAALPAVGEEFIYRGLVFTRLQMATGNLHFSALISGIIFGAVHWQPVHLLPITIMGVLFAYIYHYTRNIWYSIIIHFLINGVQIVAIYFWPEAVIGM